MNRIRGIISNIEVQNDLSLVTIETGGNSFSAIVIDTPATAAWLAVDQSIDMIFKETEVTIATHPDLPVSMRNRIPGSIVQIDRGKLLSRITIHAEVGKVKSVITTRSVDDLDLKTGMNVVAMIKTNEMMLSR